MVKRIGEYTFHKQIIQELEISLGMCFGINQSKKNLGGKEKSVCTWHLNSNLRQLIPYRRTIFRSDGSLSLLSQTMVKYLHWINELQSIHMHKIQVNDVP